MRVLITMGDVGDSQHLQLLLGDQGDEVDIAGSARATLERVAHGSFDAIIVGTDLPDSSAPDMVGMLRRSHVASPIIVYGENNVAAMVEAFDAGADDCIVPSMLDVELAARLRAVVRRGTADEGAWLRCNDLEMHLISRTVRVDGRLLRLTPREFTVLEQLLRHRDRVVGRALLRERVWGMSSYDQGSNVVAVYVARLRRKLQAGGGKVTIRTIPGSGYTLAPDAITEVAA